MKLNFPIMKSSRFFALADQAVFSGSSFAVTLGLAHLLTTTDFSILSAIILGNFLAVSIANALVIQPFQVAAVPARNSGSYLSFTLILQLSSCVPLVAAAAVVFSMYTPLNLSEHLFSMLAFMFCFLLHDFFRKYFLALGHSRRAFTIDCFLALSQIIFLCSAFYCRMHEIHRVVFCLAASYVLPLAASVYYFTFDFSDRSSWVEFLKIHVKQGSWLLLVALLQWGSGNLFAVGSGLLLGIEALGAFRLVQSLFGVLNVLLQTFENYVLPNATRLYQTSVSRSKLYLRQISLKTSLIFGLVLAALFIFSENVIVLAGGKAYASYHFLVRGMTVLYFILCIGYPIRMSVRMLILNKVFFTGYVLSFLFTVFTYSYFIRHWQLSGVIAGLIANQLLMLIYWQYQLQKNKFYLWK